MTGSSLRMKMSKAFIFLLWSHFQLFSFLIFCTLCSDWSDWQAHPVCAVCLFCEQQAERMEKIYTHMEVYELNFYIWVPEKVFDISMHFRISITNNMICFHSGNSWIWPAQIKNRLKWVMQKCCWEEPLTKQRVINVMRVICPGLKFYQQVKLVNYIRRELHQCRCYCCQEKFETKEELVQHLVNTGHVMQLPEVSHWDQPQ